MMVYSVKSGDGVDEEPDLEKLNNINLGKVPTLKDMDKLSESMVRENSLIEWALKQDKDPQWLVDDLISVNKVIVFSKSKCPYCVKIKDEFKSKGIHHMVFELDKGTHEDWGQKMQDELQNRSGQRTVPNIFIGGHHLGGHDDYQISK